MPSLEQAKQETQAPVVAEQETPEENAENSAENMPENTEETAEEKPFKWFAVQIVAKAHNKAQLKKILKDTDPKKFPTVIRGKEVTPEYRTTHQMIF